jgi:DNA-directed RNA polymerase specialized sigma24 family protein
VPSNGRFRELSDAELIRRFLGGDEAAFRALHDRHTPRLRMLVLRLLGSRRDEVDDVLQETWLAGCRGLHAFNGSARFSSWLTTIGIRAAYARFPATNGTGPEGLDDIAAPPVPAAATVIDLERALERLSDRQRAVVVLHDVEGFTHEEIAGKLAMNPGTSKVTLFRARQALRRLLTDGALHD